MGAHGVFDLEKHFAFYGAYHSNKVNILIHTLFVWPIFFSAILLLNFTPSFFNLPLINLSLFGFDFFLIINFGLLITLIYSLFYVFLDVKAGSLAALLCLLCWVFSSLLAQLLGFSLAWKKRAPALLDNLLQAFLLAPFFVLLEALQNCFSYEPYRGFHHTVKAKIEADINEWQNKKQNLLS
ncbi:2-hydroxy-palmitic acid dioxygenase mpo1-like isoform X2 [Apium graveolens]|uniref:2-hydroxy-palmitic acid dioxygenase mpo1-like isoform X2 n=1 Tax=Apium graveolens TaxID=4045 RepID=UPI003D7A3008